MYLWDPLSARCKQAKVDVVFICAVTPSTNVVLGCFWAGGFQSLGQQVVWGTFRCGVCEFSKVDEEIDLILIYLLICIPYCLSSNILCMSIFYFWIPSEEPSPQSIHHDMIFGSKTLVKRWACNLLNGVRPWSLDISGLAPLQQSAKKTWTVEMFKTLLGTITYISPTVNGLFESMIFRLFPFGGICWQFPGGYHLGWWRIQVNVVDCMICHCDLEVVYLMMQQKASVCCW